MNSESTLEQAVILCGGLGTRLRPLTDSLPKPMVPVNGKPFLHHLLTQLADQGVKRFVLLTGYLGEKISDYFGDGAQYGWAISYSSGPVAWDTGRRLWEARELCDCKFLLLYSDNFVQFRLKQLKRLHSQLHTRITLLLAPKAKGNIKVSEDGRIQAYDKHRIGVGFDFVEIGYMAVERDSFFADFPSCEGFPDFSLSALIQIYAQQQLLGGLIVRDPYHSISDPQRLMLTCEYLKPKKILLIDRDGTINEKTSKGEYITSWKQFKWISSTRQALKILAADGFKFIVITNQAGIARKMIEPNTLEEIHQEMTRELLVDGIEVLKVYVSPHHWDENSFMRKPSPGMFFQAAKEFNLRMDRVMYVGDDDRDCLAAANAGCGMVYLTAEDEVKRDQHAGYPEVLFQGPSLLDHIDNIRGYYSLWEQSHAFRK